MTHAIRFHVHGDADVLRWDSVDLPDPAPTEVRLRHTAIGLNFIDIYQRTGLYASTLPAVPGREAAGVIEAVGSKVRDFAVGDRVAYAANESGAYSEARNLGSQRVVKLPAEIDDRTAAAALLKGLTAQVLLRQVHRVRRSDQVVIHAAAGGVGMIAVQWAKFLGATVIAIVGSQQKAATVRALGADHVLLLQDDWKAQVRSITRKRGVDVVYDSVGNDTFHASLDCLRPRGLMVSYGNSSGPVPPVAPLELSNRGSLFLTRPTLFHYTATRAALQRAANELFDLIRSSAIKIRIGQSYPLRDAARAHRDLESRVTIGSSVLLP